MRVLLSTSIMICCSFTLLAQEFEIKQSAPDNWRKEIIEFPLDFAPEINLSGYEEILFAPGWSDSDAEDFWTYYFVF